MFVLIVSILTFCGLIHLLRGGVFSLVLGFVIFGNAANFLIFTISKPELNSYPFIPLVGEKTNMVDPLPQALILTAIVIAFAVLCYLVALARNLSETYQVTHYTDMLDEGTNE